MKLRVCGENRITGLRVKSTFARVEADSSHASLHDDPRSSGVTSRAGVASSHCHFGGGKNLVRDRAANRRNAEVDVTRIPNSASITTTKDWIDWIDWIEKTIQGA